MAKEILCVIDIDENRIRKSSLEIISTAKKIKELDGCDKISAVVLNKTPDKYKDELFSYGVDTVYGVKSSSLNLYRTVAYSKAIKGLCEKVNPGYILISGTGNGRDLGPYISIALYGAIIADIIDVVKESDEIAFVRPIFVGNLLSYNAFVDTDTIKILTVRPKAFPVPEKNEGRSGDYVEISVDIKEDEIPTRVLEVVKETGKINLQDADFIVSGGRGMGGPENFKMLEELANLLNGAVGASRAAVDSGWVPYDNQVGQTGKTVKPKIYFAFGISGAIQHLAGMRTSDIIVAVNTDKEAPIFKTATYGIVDDLFKVIPVLKDEIKKRIVR